jgi:hypothetical protein
MEAGRGFLRHPMKNTIAMVSGFLLSIEVYSALNTRTRQKQNAAGIEESPSLDQADETVMQQEDIA